MVYCKIKINFNLNISDKEIVYENVQNPNIISKRRTYESSPYIDRNIYCIVKTKRF